MTILDDDGQHVIDCRAAARSDRHSTANTSLGHRSASFCACAANDLGRTRLGLSIGTRVGKAVRRVRVKRMIREAFRLVRCEIPLGMDVVVSARSHPDRPLADYKHAIVEESKRLAIQLKLKDSRSE